MAYQALDAERGYVAYDPVADSETLGQSGRACRKPLWIAGLVVCGVVALGGRAISSSPIVTQSAVGSYDASQYMPKGNVMACLQSSCNMVVAGLAVQQDDLSRNLITCVTGAGDSVKGGTCFDEKTSKTHPEIAALHTCAVCKQCIPGDVSPKRCAALPQSDNDLRGPPATGSDSGYSQYIPSSSLSQAPQSSTPSAYIAGTTAAWSMFLTNTASSDVVPTSVIPTNTIPAVADEVSSDLSHADDQVSAGLAHAQGLSPKERARIEDKVASKLGQVDKKVSSELSHADDEILRADDKTSSELRHVNDKLNQEYSREDARRAYGLGIADEKIAQHVDDNPKVPDTVPSYIPQLSNPQPSGSYVPMFAAALGKIEGTNVAWSKYLPGKSESRGAVHGGDPLEYVPTNYAVQTSNAHASNEKAPAKKKASSKRLLNACMQMNCNSAIAALGAGIGASTQTSELTRCIQNSKTAVTASACFKQFPSPEGEALKTCLVCHHCLAGSLTPDKCLTSQNPNDMRGPF